MPVNCQIHCHLLTTLCGTVEGAIERDAPSRVPKNASADLTQAIAWQIDTE
jgi:hypothetical protein